MTVLFDKLFDTDTKRDNLFILLLLWFPPQVNVTSVHKNLFSSSKKHTLSFVAEMLFEKFFMKLII